MAKVATQSWQPRSSNLLCVEFLSLDLSGLNNVRCRGLENSLFAQLEAQCFHPTQQADLQVTGHGELRAQTYWGIKLLRLRQHYVTKMAGGAGLSVPIPCNGSKNGPKELTVHACWGRALVMLYETPQARQASERTSVPVA